MSSFIQPKSLNDALLATQEHPDYLVLAGGTDALVASKNKEAPKGIINIFGLDEICGVTTSQQGGVRIGACTTYASLLSDSRIADRFRLLHQACREVGAAQIQARGTIGGNIATSSPVGDTLPALMALDAQIEVASHTGRRSIPYRNFPTAYRKTQLKENEIITAIHLPAVGSRTFQFWRKVGTRRALSISKVMMASIGEMEEGKITNIRIGLGAVADRTIRALDTEASLLGKEVNSLTIGVACQALRAEIHPIDDMRSTSVYRLRVAENLLSRFLHQLKEMN